MKCWINPRSPGGCHVSSSSATPRREWLGKRFPDSARNGSICTCRCDTGKSGEQGWRQGTTDNISRSGLLFKAEEVLQPNAQLEINLVLPAEIAGLSPTEVVCRGEVVRSVEGEGALDESGTGGENSAVSLPARPSCVGSVARRPMQGRLGPGARPAVLPGSAVSCHTHRFASKGEQGRSPLTS